VTRTKSRWKCSLKDGIMHINNKDILFNKVSFPLMIDGNSIVLSVFILYWTLAQKFSLECFLSSAGNRRIRLLILLESIYSAEQMQRDHWVFSNFSLIIIIN
jgi:hypothetical protein